MKYADIIIPHGRSNTIAIDFVLQNLKARVNLPVADETTSPNVVCDSPTYGYKRMDNDKLIDICYPNDEEVKKQVHTMMCKLNEESE
jgi:hypothetical protein